MIPYWLKPSIIFVVKCPSHTKAQLKLSFVIACCGTPFS